MPLDEPLYPINLRIAGHRCLVVGAGTVAAQKIGGLLDCDAEIVVVAPEVFEPVEALADRVEIIRRRYRPEDLTGMRLVVAATGDGALQAQILADGRAAGVLVNSADDPANCDFTLPSRVRRGPVLLTASTQGHSPALSTWLRRRLSQDYGPEIEVLCGLLAEAREEIRDQGLSSEGLAWQEALDSGMLELVREGRLVEAKERLQACLSSSSE
ncbi:MAG: bifunctional precorrin-2 dehydrogenase/sirohydrochlorin ferrochelatase [Acidimicrobiales bacterium]